MTKLDLIEKISDKLDMTKVASKEVVETIIDVITDTLANGEEVSLYGFGKFVVKERAGRTGRNPQTGETIEIAPSKTLSFKAAKTLKDIVKGK